ncbi:ATP-binding protein [Planomonospora sp. ID82291]|uniref:ATP-binding protein n=1 Tax=Planomonospora sp. ID82291 TaxID=2738136 RepID=UPI0018C37C13|nr:ATP-binding protein [Planomonospora sp. ID82291]MBG0816064.1 ATP-binding protein [Planomonospora sp. ID82291]
MEEVVTAITAPAGRRSPLGPVLAVLGERWIPRDGRCVASVRRFVRDTAADWDAAEDVPEVAELLASELTTNALVHGLPGDRPVGPRHGAHGTSGAPGTPGAYSAHDVVGAFGRAGNSPADVLRVTVCRQDTLLTVTVHDPCLTLPRMREVDDLSPSGRGLAIVQTFSHDWGWTLTPYGKSVWFQVLAWP